MRSNRLTAGLTALCAVAVSVAAGCASTPIPNEKLAVAKDSVARAEAAGAVELAPVEIAAARDTLGRAEKAAADKQAQPGRSLAGHANVDAKLAEATAQQNKTHKAATELDASLQALRNESSRSS